MTSDVKNLWEKVFGKEPEKGYKFHGTKVEVVDSDIFKGFVIHWSAAGIGFGQVFVGWGLNVKKLKSYPKQQGFHTDTECMSQEFVEALMKEVAPELAKIITEKDNS